MNTCRIFLQLLKRDLHIYRKEYPGKLFDILMTFVIWVIIFGYFIPKMGNSNPEYGVFIMVGAIASFGVFDIIGKAGILINDIQSDRKISYLLLLPISSTFVFCYQALSWAIQSFIIAIPLYFIGKGIFWSQFNLLNISWYQAGLALLTVNIFFGFFALFLVSVLTKVTDLSRIYFRFINPLFLLGCYFFTAKVAFAVSPWVGLLTYLDPFSYVMEISRAALLGSDAYLPFWVSFAALWVYIVSLGYIGIKRLKRILDCL
ncbi:MAG: hypothetical protein S4CHLAM7_07660 [Chlamydiae bacterium]|nr:hypothetical protein [Chlamydiota bacterium]